MSYNEAYDKANSCDVASMEKTFASSFEIIDPTISSDSDTECSSFCWISQEEPSLSSDDDSDSDSGSDSDSEESDNDSEKLRSAL